MSELGVAPASGPPMHKRLARWSAAAFLCMAAAFFLGQAGRYDYRLELLSHFLEHYLVAALVFAPVFLFLRRPRWAYAAAALALILFIQVLPWYSARNVVPTELTRNLRMLQANVLRANPDDTAFLALVNETLPDIISLQELDQRRLNAIQPLLEQYPHHIIEPREDNFGIALLSKLPLEDPKVTWPENSPVPAIEAVISLNGKEIHLLCIHTLPPGSRSFSETRNRQLRYIGDFARNAKGAVIVVGDLNCTPWSPWFRETLGGSDLRDTRRGYGVLRTWPAFFPLRIPIDYVLVQGDIRVLHTALGPDIGSDHLPLIADLRVGD